MDGGGTPAPAPTPLRWGISDAAIGWVLSLFGGLMATAPFVDGRRIPRADEPIATFASVALQNLVLVAVLLFVTRSKGRRSLALDFGLRIRVADAHWILAGLGAGVVATALVAPLLELGDLDKRSQDVVRIFDDASGVELALLTIGVLVIAPIGEELLFRGVLLRGLLRTVPLGWALFVSALIFAVVHAALDPGARGVVPGLLLLGLIAAWRAWATGSLSQAIFLHAGFNLLAVIGIVLDLDV